MAQPDIAEFVFALPPLTLLGEVPRRGGRVLHSLLYDDIDLLADPSEIPIDLQIRKAKHKQSKLLQVRCSLAIFLFGHLIIMLRAVQLDHQLCACTVKIYDILTKNFLSVKSNRILAQEIVPKAPFFLRHFLSKFTPEGNKGGISFCDQAFVIPLRHCTPHPFVLPSAIHLP